MDNLLFVPDIMARYQVSAPTARKIMRQMIHMENPKLAVSESTVLAYERDRMETPGKARKAPRKTPAGFEPIERGPDGKYHLSRKRA